MARAERRSSCPISYALELFGDRWSLLVIRDLALKNKSSFSELLASDEGIARNVLADRLARLEGRGLIEKRPDPDDGRRRVYRLTEAGKDLLPLLVEVIVWSGTHDAETAAPDAFLREARADRAGLLKRLRNRLD